MDLCFYIRRNDAVNKSGQTSIYCTITINGSSCVPFSTGIKVIAKNWLPKKKTTNDEFADVVRREINRVENLLRKIKSDLEDASKVCTANVVKSIFCEIRSKAIKSKPDSPKEKTTFLELAKNYLHKKIRMGASVNTKKNNNTYINNLTTYLASIKQKNIVPSKIDYDFIEEFQMYFQYDKGNSKNYTNCHIGFISSVLDYAVLKKHIKHNPLLSLKLNYSEKHDNKGVTESELLLLQNATDLTEKEQKAIDIFLFLCGSAIDYCDYLNLRNDNLIERNGKLIIKHERDKTDKYTSENINVASPILKESALRILQKYGSIENLPRYKNSQNVNRNIQAVAKRLNIKTHLTTKRGRKTFTNMSVNKELHTDEQTAYQLGHSSTKQLKHYRAYADEILESLL
ncbi:tyrosine-type recombinase/integrase [Emticicia sp. 17c]|uniref:tyrosine-type recombinase/integrase n=1 Tax=Emticicia sp. 17c TaxID=3127704 RepID=UPI00301E15D5